MTHILYSNIDRKYWFYQPNLIRWRHRYRSPRESLRLNQETGQTAYDIRRVYDQNNINATTLSTLVDYIINGWDLDNQILYNWVGDATPSDAPASLMGITEMASRIEKLRIKIKDLEN